MATLAETTLPPVKEVLMQAIVNNDLETVNTLLASCEAEDLDFSNSEGLNPLLLASLELQEKLLQGSLNSRFAILESIIEKAPQLLGTRDSEENSALQYLIP